MMNFDLAKIYEPLHVSQMMSYKICFGFRASFKRVPHWICKSMENVDGNLFHKS